jgi:microcin C transport system permease protein
MQNKGVWQLIKEKLPVSIAGAVDLSDQLRHLIPLGVAKAVREGTRFDAFTTWRCCWATPFRALCWASC